MGTLRGSENAQGSTDETCQLCRKGNSDDATKWSAGAAPHRILNLFLPNIDTHVAVDVNYAVGDQPGAARLSRASCLRTHQKRPTHKNTPVILVIRTWTCAEQPRKIKAHTERLGNVQPALVQVCRCGVTFIRTKRL